MKKLFFLILALFIIASPPSALAQKKKTKTSQARSSRSKKSAKKKPIAKANSKQATVAKAADNSALFEKVYLVHRDKEQQNSLIKNPQAITTMENYIRSAIGQHVFPGCQLVALKNGVVIYDKSFGSYLYDRVTPVTDTSLYDIASVTKIVSTTLAVMKLVDEGKIALNGTLAGYLSWVKGTDKAGLRISDLLTHQAGLKSWIPFYKASLDAVTGSPRNDLYRMRADSIFSVPVASNLFMRKTYIDTMWATVLASPLENRGRYVYSDLDLMFMQQVVEAVTGQKLDAYVYENFYRPLGLKHTFFNPWKRGLQKQCVPTEEDNLFRLQLVQGYVHDPGAAMLGGVAGHAGIFSTAEDLSIILQMLLNGGEYRGRKFFSTETVRLFTGYRSGISRRGYGFDKPEKQAGDGGPASSSCSKATFGHQGFTGTCAWADPETGITFVFLCNRVYPSADNSLINKLSVRTNLQNYIYQALGVRP